ncbi:MAG: TolC family protein [Acidobacteriota bacterium]
MNRIEGRPFGAVFVGVAMVLALCCAGSVVHADSAPGTVRIALVVDGPSAMTDDLVTSLRDEIRVLTEGEFDVAFGPPTGPPLLAGAWTVPSVEAVIDRVLDDESIDLVIAVGPIVSQAFCCRGELPKPVIAAIIVDADLQGLPRAPGGGSGVVNLNYLSLPDSVASDVAEMRRIVPFERATLVFNRWFLDAAPALGESVAEAFAAQGIDASLTLVGDSVDAALDAIPTDAEVAFVAPLLHLERAERQQFYDGLAARGLPSFSFFGVPELEDGAFAAQRDITFYQRLARRVALNVQRILLGESAEELSVTISDRRRLTINMEVARRIDTLPPWEVLAEADLVNEEPDYDRRLSLELAVAEAIDANLDLRAGQREVTAGAQEIERARAALRPQLDASLSGVMIDDDRANPLAGQSERSATAALTLEQLVYAEPASANVAIQQALQRAREASFDTLRLDIVRDAALRYLDVLRAETFERIRREDVRVTRSNLELAQIRQDVGSAGPGEVYRWQASLAQARRDLITAQEQRLQAMEALNRLLHRPLDDGYDLRDLTLDDQEFLATHAEISSYTGSPRHFRVFTAFQVAEGLARAPELRAADDSIAAQQRAVESARRALRRPTLALQASLDEVLARAGEGSDGVPGGPDDTSWSVALAGRFSLFTGGERVAALVQAEEELEGLRSERGALAERLEQRIRATLHGTRASASGIRLAREASVAAARALDVVTAAYREGTVDILDLLDAQNTALQADLGAADARYQFFIDLMEHQRAVSRFEFFDQRADDAAWLERLAVHFAAAGVDPTPPRVWWSDPPHDTTPREEP